MENGFVLKIDSNGDFRGSDSKFLLEQCMMLGEMIEKSELLILSYPNGKPQIIDKEGNNINIEFTGDAK